MKRSPGVVLEARAKPTDRRTPRDFGVAPVNGIVVNADDFGLSVGADLGIAKAYRKGVVTSASIVPASPGYAHALEVYRRDCSGMGLGLHFTLSAGSPVSEAAAVPLLVGRNGRFRWSFMSLLAAVKGRSGDRLLNQIAVELEAQIRRPQDNGLTLDHINSERHVHQIPGVFELVVAAADRWNIPFVRQGRDVGPSHLAALRSQPVMAVAGFVKYCLLSALSIRNRKLGAGVQLSNHFASYLFSGRLDLILARLLQTAPSAGVTEVMVHPGLPEQSHHVDLGNPKLEAYLCSEDRRRELDACIAAAGLKTPVPLTTFGELAP